MEPRSGFSRPSDFAGDIGRNDTQTATYAAAGVPVADVAGAFHNDDPVPSAQLVCGWTWFWSFGDTHPNTAGYGVISQALLVGDEGSILVAIIVGSMQASHPEAQ
jgi:hypothetical protein